MLRKNALRSITGLALVLSAEVAAAAEWHPVAAHRRAAATAVSQGRRADAGAAARRYLTEASAELDIGSVRLASRRDLAATGARRTVRFDQEHHGLPVLGAAAAVRLGPQGEVTLAVLDVARDLTVSPVPSLTEADARSVVESALGRAIPTPLVQSLAVHRAGAGGTLVWSVDVPDRTGAHRYLVDAHRGLLVAQRGLGLDVLGRVYPVSASVTPATADVELLSLDTSAPQKLTGWGGQLTVTNYVSGGSQGEIVVAQDLVPSAGEDFLYDPPALATDGTDAFAQVGIYHHLTRMREFFQGSLGLDMSDPSWKLTAVANMQEAGEPLDNAFFSPSGLEGAFASPNLIAIGQGTTFDLADDSDVFLHEFTHYVSHNAIGYNEGQLGTSEYGLSTFGGSIDEGAADYFACTENGDPILGESLGALGASRDLGDTSKTCPDDMIGEVHADGEIIGSVSWSLRESLGKPVADQLVWGALSLLTPGASFADFARGIAETADEMVTDAVLTETQASAIDELLRTRGLDDCDHELEVTPTETRKTTMFGLDVAGQAFGSSCDELKGFGLALQSLFHFRTTPAAGDERIRFSVDLTQIGGGDGLDWGIYVRRNEHVGFSPGGFLPEVAARDYEVVGITGEAGEIVIDASSDPPFDPAVTYHMVIAHQNCPVTQAVISVDSAPPTTGEGGAGGTGATTTGAATTTSSVGGTDFAGDDVAEGDGCGCRVPGDRDGSPAPWALVAGLFAAAALRLRRRPR